MRISENLNTAIADTCDVLVCGGGFAGISAALAAARQGKRVILLEKQYMLGGLGTAGLVTIYLPLCDGMGHQVSFGIAEELLRLSISMGAEKEYPSRWLNPDHPEPPSPHNHRFMTRYNAQLFAILAEQLLLKEGVEIFYGAYAVGVHCKNDRIDAVIIESKSGRQAIRAASVVDATGDCDIAHFAGAPTETFKQGNVLAAWYYYADPDGYHLNMLGFADIPNSEKKSGHQEQHLLARRFGGLDGKELSEYMQLSHKASLDDICKRREETPDLWPVTIATTPQIRMTRHLVGEFTVDDSHMHRYVEDSIGMVSDWRKRGPVYEVPFRSLYSSRIKNLITAGRCTSVTESMWDIMRVIPCCAVTGQAAGTAAAMTDDFTTLDISELQKILEENGVLLHETN